MSESIFGIELSLTYQIDFDNGKELLQKLGLRKKKQQDSIPEKIVKDTIITDNKILIFKNKKTIQK